MNTELEEGQKNDQIYKWNSWFLYLYALRMVFYTVAGLVAIIFVMNTDTSAEFLCDRYTTLEFEEHDDTQWDHCLARVRIMVWLVYLPWLLFQFHCLQVLIKHRLIHENVAIDAYEEDDI